MAEQKKDNEHELMTKLSEQNKIIESLKQKLLDKEKELEKYKNDDDKKNKFVLSIDELNQILDDKLSNIMIKTDDNDKNEEIISLQNELKEKEDRIKRLESIAISTDELNKYLQRLQNKINTVSSNIADIKNEMKSMLDDQRKCIGLDVAQTMRFLKEQSNNNNNNNHIDEMLNKLQININKHQVLINNNFINLKQEFDELRLEIMDNNKNKDDEEDDDDGKDLEYEYTTTRTSISPSPSQQILESLPDFHVLETRIVENVNKSIKSIKPSYLKIGASTFIPIFASYLLLFLFFRKGRKKKTI